jgi:Family of unknown function (DUF5682)
MKGVELHNGRPFVRSELDGVLSALVTPGCVYFPIRHHSPACSWHLEKLIRELRPSAVLVEGPGSFTPLIPAILDPDTKPPVAIYTHYVDVERKLYKPAESELDLGPARFAAYYPFCDYSPEFIALRVGREVGAALRFIDLDYADQVLAEHLAGEQLSKPRIETLMQERHLQRSAYLNALAQRSGCRDFNEMWDHLFEANFQSRPTRSFIDEVATYCFFGRVDASDAALEADGTSAREQAMAAAIDEQTLTRSADDGPVLVVTGGFHTVALPGLVGKEKRSTASTSLSPDSTQQALIRYSFRQLDALNGYSAGMPSPNYYSRLWREIAGGGAAPHSRVAVSFLVEIGGITRKKDMQVALSAADEIAALQQARHLASMRGHTGPTREDLLDGVRSSFVKGSMDGEGAIVMGLVRHILTGSEIGNVPASAGTPPIVSSFRKEAERVRLDISNSLKKQVALEIYRRENHRRTSRFLHSVSFLNVPFATLASGPDFVKGTGLERIHEHWQYSWSPMTEGALVEASVYGATIEEATANRLREAIARLAEEGQGRSANAAVAMLIRACRMGLHRHTPQLLNLIASRIAEEPSFVDAVGAASQLLLLWKSREPLQAHSLKEVPELLRASYLRACYLAPGLGQCPEGELSGALNSLSAVRELIAAATPRLVDAELFWNAISGVLKTQNQSHPPFSTICGAIAGLLYSVGRMDERALDELVVGQLVGVPDSQRRVGFLRGLLKTCREAAWQNLPLIHALDEIIGGWEESDFISALPSLRLALADLTPRETDKVAALVASLHGRTQLGGLVQMQVTEWQLELNRRATALVLEILEKDGLAQWLGGAETHG